MSECVRILKFLFAPLNTTNVDIVEILCKCVDNYLSNISDDVFKSQLTNLEVYEAFFECCLHGILNICKSLELNQVENLDILFTVNEENSILKCMEFVICFGIYPLIDSGVYLPLEMRIESYEKFNCPKNINHQNRIETIMKIATCMIDLKNSRSCQLQKLITPNLFLGDLIAILVQLSYGMNSYLNSLNNSHTIDIMSKKSIIDNGRKQVWKLLTDIPRHVALKELLILQGGSHSNKKIQNKKKLPVAPNWLRKCCGHLLSRLLIHPSAICSSTSSEKLVHLGVRSLIIASMTLTRTICSNEPIDPRRQPELAVALARILASPPGFLNASKAPDALKHYYEIISSQVLDMLKLDEVAKFLSPDLNIDISSIGRFGYCVGIQVVHNVCEACPDLGKTLFLWPLVGLLQEFCEDNADYVIKPRFYKESLNVPNSTVDMILATSEDLKRFLKYTIDLIDLPSPSPVVLTELCKFSCPLFYFLSQTLHNEPLTDEADDQTDISSSSDLNDVLYKLLSRLLTVGCNNRLSRLHLVRNWLNLAKEPTTNSNLPTYYRCKDRMIFRRRPKIQIISNNSNPKPDYCKSAIPIPFEVDYECVQTVDDLCANRPLILFQSIHTLIKLFEFMYAKRLDHKDEFNLAVETDCSKDDDWEVDSLPADLFLDIIGDMNNQILDMIENRSNNLGNLIAESQSSKTDDQMIQTGMTSTLLASNMLESLGSLIWPRELNKAIDLFLLNLDRFYQIVQNANDSEVFEVINDTLSHLLGILAFYISQLEPVSSQHVDCSDRNQFGRLVPVLTQLECALKEWTAVDCSSIVNLIFGIRTSLVTRGAVWPKEEQPVSQHVGHVQVLCSSAKSPDRPTCPLRSKKLIEEIDLESDNVEYNQAEMYSIDDPILKSIFDQLKDPFLPVQGHALIELARLLEQRDSRVLDHEGFIFELLVKKLAHLDSYIYLNAIRGLTAMGDVYTEKALRVLLHHFVKQKHLNEDYRLKLGEAIMRVLRNLGETAPVYRSEILNAFSSGCKDIEPLIRAASLSNLGEFVQLLKYSIQPIIYELLILIEFHLTQDKSPIVRKGAAFLARSIFMTSSSDMGLPCWLPDDVLRDLYRLLSSRIKIESNCEVCEQIEAAIGELDRCARNAVFVKPDSPSSLIKKIKILNL